VTNLGKQAMPVPQNFNAGQFAARALELRWVKAEGVVTEVRKIYDGVTLEMTFGAGRIFLKVANGDYDGLSRWLHRRITATGIFQNAYDLDGQITPTILISDPQNMAVVEKDPAPWISAPETTPAQITNAAATGLPLLTKAMQVKSLSRAEGLRGYPVILQGVITARVGNDFVLQDATWSVFCYGEQLNQNHLPAIGELWQIEGISDVGFAPHVMAHRAVFLGPGILPPPIRPTKDELDNGSLDTQLIELLGIVTAVSTNGVKLLTREGELKFTGLEDLGLDRLKDALIRINGVCIPDRDTNQMLRPAWSSIRLFNASASVEEPAPADLFALPLKHISDLLLFDARADALHRVKIAGQMLHESRGEYFIADGDSGARFELRDALPLTAGELVEVVGFPDVSGPSPVLHEALVRVAGHAKLPAAHALSEADAANSKRDATLVSLKSRLLGMNKSYAEVTLELQLGTRNYQARLAAKDGILPDILPGSSLQLTGIYVAHGGTFNPENIHSFELLLTSPADVHVLERPSWWTARHALIVVGGMLVLILGALIWITLLHRQVEERTAQLASEIKGREQAESQRALEAERTRIAQDLHDELGATLTEIRFLGAVKSRDPSVVEDLRSHLKEVSEKSHQMVSSLDEIVWAVNPANDALPNLANYLCHVAEEFFRASEIRCRLDLDEILPAVSLSSEVRHSLYLVVREALNNVAKHSHATEAWLRIHYQAPILRIVIEDNGRGFEIGPEGAARNGLNNMRSRLKKIGGAFHCDSQPGRGTVCRCELPLAENQSL
jgi:signal transduction histidine kinase